MTDMASRKASVFLIALVLVLDAKCSQTAKIERRDIGVNGIPIIYKGEAGLLPYAPVQYYGAGVEESGVEHAVGAVGNGLGVAGIGAGARGIGLGAGVRNGVTGDAIGIANAVPVGVGIGSGIPVAAVGLGNGALGGIGGSTLHHRPFLSGGFSGGAQQGTSGGFIHRDNEIGGGEFNAAGGYSRKGQSGGDAGYHSTNVYVDDNRHAGDNVAHSGYFNDVSRGLKAQQDGGLYERGQAFGRGSKVNSESSLNNGYKKGHHSSGFHSSYHKDESGRDTKFYDDDHDEGRHVNAHDFGDFFGSRGLSAAKGKGEAEGLTATSRAAQENFGAGRLEGASSGLRDAHGHQGYYGHQGDYGHEAAGGLQSGGKGSFGSGHSLQDANSRAFGYIH